MNNIVKISPSMYKHAFEVMETCYPDRAKMLTPDITGGTFYYFTKYSGYVNLLEIAPGLIEVRGAFKVRGGTSGFAVAVVQWCKQLGASVIQLDCYEPVAHIWYAAGFDTYKIVPFDLEQAPDGWPADVYGLPDVHYMVH